MCSNQHPKVSVVIPTYNSGSTLRACLESVRRQSYSPYEVIVVDSFSKDSTVEVAKEFEAKIIKCEGFPSKARNVGVKGTAGDYLLFLDSDEALGNGVVEQCVELCKKGADFVCFNLIFIGKDYWSSCSALLRNLLGLVLKEIGENHPIPRFFKREIFVSVGLFDENLLLGEDWELYLRTKASGAKEAFLQPIVYHNESPSLKGMLTKELRYGISSSLKHYGVTPWPKYALILTAKKIMLCLDHSPFLRLGALFLLLLRSLARVCGSILSAVSAPRSFWATRVPEGNVSKYNGRLRVVEALKSKDRFSLDVGCKNVRMGTINVDIDRTFSPDIVADARFLPFRSEVFEQAIFTDVIEHLPKNDEAKALQEINMVLRREGELILTTPNEEFLSTTIDPHRYLAGHRHYAKKEVTNLLSVNGFRIEKLLIFGGFWVAINLLLYCFLVHPFKIILRLPPRPISPSYIPAFLERLENKSYNYSSARGYSIFVKAIKWADQSTSKEKRIFSLDLKATGSTVAYPTIVKARTTKRFAGNPKRLLNIGCGWGRETFHYKDAVGLDKHLPHLKKARKYSDNEFVCGDAEHLPFRDECFDFTRMSEVIEHLPDPDKAIDEIKRVLENRGRVVIQTPNRSVTRGIYTHKDHIHEFTVPELISFLNKHGFVVLKRTGSTIPFIPYGWKRFYHINFHSYFFSVWKILNKIIPIKWDIIILAQKTR